jgi:hypothetical protein
MFWIGFLLGGIVGLFFMASCVVAGDDDNGKR